MVRVGADSSQNMLQQDNTETVMAVANGSILLQHLACLTQSARLKRPIVLQCRQAWLMAHVLQMVLTAFGLAWWGQKHLTLMCLIVCLATIMIC